MGQRTAGAVGHDFKKVAGQYDGRTAAVLYMSLGRCGMTVLEIRNEIRGYVQGDCACPYGAAGNADGCIRQCVQGATVNIAREVCMDLFFYIHVQTRDTTFDVIDDDAAVLYELVRAEYILYDGKAGFFIHCGSPLPFPRYS